MPQDDDWRPPSPGVSTATLMLVFLTAMTLFNVAALLLHEGPATLKVVLAVLMVTPLPLGVWWVARARRRGQNDAPILGMTFLGAFLVQSAARPLLDLSGGRPLNVFDTALLVLVPPFLLGLLVAWARTRRG